MIRPGEEKIYFTLAKEVILQDTIPSAARWAVHLPIHLLKKAVRITNQCLYIDLATMELAISKIQRAVIRRCAIQQIASQARPIRKPAVIRCPGWQTLEEIRKKPVTAPFGGPIRGLAFLHRDEFYDSIQIIGQPTTVKLRSPFQIHTIRAARAGTGRIHSERADDCSGTYGNHCIADL